MYTGAILWLFLGVILAYPSSSVSLTTEHHKILDDREAVYNVTTNFIDDIKESTFAITLKCRPRTSDILSCSLDDPKYINNYDTRTCKDSSPCNDKKHLSLVNSYAGNFEIKYRGAFVERITVSSSTSLKQLSFYRTMANLLFLGVDINKKTEGTFSMIEESVYGKCEARVKIVRNIQFEGDKKAPHQIVSVKRTRNLESCYPVAGLLIFDDLFHHPMMASVHYDIKSSISRWIVSANTYTSYTTEDIAVKSLESGGNTTMLHVRTTLTQHSLNKSSDPIPLIIDPVSVKLPFVDGFDPSHRNNNKTDVNYQTSNPIAM